MCAKQSDVSKVDQREVRRTGATVDDAAPMDDERLLDLLIEHAVEHGSLLVET